MSKRGHSQGVIVFDTFSCWVVSFYDFSQNNCFRLNRLGFHLGKAFCAPFLIVRRHESATLRLSLDQSLVLARISDLNSVASRNALEASCQWQSSLVRIIWIVCIVWADSVIHLELVPFSSMIEITKGFVYVLSVCCIWLHLGNCHLTYLLQLYQRRGS